jgi:hydrogenase nickel incorporation protein HypA/HybF
MHEVGLVADAIAHAERVAREAGASRIERVAFELRIGGHVKREAVETIFLALSKGTMAEGAVLVIEEPHPPTSQCIHCAVRSDQVRFVALSPDSTCPSCGAPLVPDSRGPELVLTSVDVAD